MLLQMIHLNFRCNIFILSHQKSEGSDKTSQTSIIFHFRPQATHTDRLCLLYASAERQPFVILPCTRSYFILTFWVLTKDKISVVSRSAQNDSFCTFPAQCEVLDNCHFALRAKSQLLNASRSGENDVISMQNFSLCTLCSQREVT